MKIGWFFCLVFLCFLSRFCAAVKPSLTNNWVVLVAGSNGWDNARHQADVCHAYQLAREHGTPDERIIVMQYDDIASNPSNPFPGQVFNAPSEGSGWDVYANCKKDYVGENVTAQNFLWVITGDTRAQGKILQSTEHDHVFINLVDHGAPDVFAFPTGPYLSSQELQKAIQIMQEKKMFGKLFLAIESCESGSMAQFLSSTDNVYAITAANAEEPSWATYCPPDDVVDNTPVGTCLGDLFSVKWMEDDDRQTVLNESLEVQWFRVRAETTMSHVMQYGNLHVAREPIKRFLGADMSQRVPVKNDRPALHQGIGTVSSRDVDIHLAYYRWLRASPEDRQHFREKLIVLLQSVTTD